MNWQDNTNRLKTNRVIWISDGDVGYWADLPIDMTETDAINDFVSTYDYGEHDNEVRLRRRIEVEFPAVLYAQTGRDQEQERAS